MEKILGFDIGIASIGWAYLEGNELKDCGVRIFTKAEQSDGASLALPRREARSARRRIRRRRARMVKLKHLICKEFSIKFDEFLSKNFKIAPFFIHNNAIKSPYELRAKALNQKLEEAEFIRVILHIAKHRGYGNKNSKNGKEEGDIKEALSQNEKSMLELGYKTIGEYLNGEFFKKYRDDSKDFKNVRNKKGNYSLCVSRKLLEDEVNIIFEKQKEFGFKFKNYEKFKDDFLKIAFSQRPLKDFSHLVGRCTFFENEQRAAKNSISALKFVALTKIINTIKNLEKEYKGLIISNDKISEILKIVMESGKISYKKFSEILKLPNEKSGNFIEFKNYIAFKKALGDKFNSFSENELDEIAKIITLTKDEEKLKNELEKFNFNDEEFSEIYELNFKEFINLSLKALYEILPFMQNGLRYDEAVKEAGLKEKQTQKSELLPPFCDTIYKNDLTNPVVNRAIAEYRKVLNSLIKKYGKMHRIRIELTRETGKSYHARKEIEKQQKYNFEKNEELKSLCKEHGLAKNSKNILKLKLWQEQDEFCIYSGKKITINDLEDEKMLEVDHILPYSRSFDDSYDNKVLVFTSQNQKKGNRTPFEAFGNDEEKWQRINIFAKSKKVSERKFLNLTNKNFKDKKFKDRNLNDTSYIARLIQNYTKNYLEFLPLAKNDENKIHVEARKGALTANIRHYLGLKKDRNNHLHHAIDAIVLAYSNQSMLQNFTDYMKTKELYRNNLETKEKKEEDNNKFKKSCENIFLNKFDKDEIRKLLQNKAENIFVSQPPRKKMSGALHLETCYKQIDFYKEYGGEEGVKRALELGKIRKVKNKIFMNGSMVRVDIFEKDKKFYGVPVYTMDVALGILPNKACVGGKDKNGVIKDWLLMDESFNFKFSLYPNDLIKIKKKGMEEAEFVYYIKFNNTNAQIDLKSHNNKFENLTPNQNKLFTAAKPGEVSAKSVGIQNLEVFEKYIVSPLGEIKDYIYQPRQDIKKKEK